VRVLSDSQDTATSEILKLSDRVSGRSLGSESVCYASATACSAVLSERVLSEWCESVETRQTPLPWRRHRLQTKIEIRSTSRVFRGAASGYVANGKCGRSGE
jgi:hypothetical protein